MTAIGLGFIKHSFKHSYCTVVLWLGQSLASDPFCYDSNDSNDSNDSKCLFLTVPGSC